MQSPCEAGESRRTYFRPRNVPGERPELPDVRGDICYALRRTTKERPIKTGAGILILYDALLRRLEKWPRHRTVPSASL